MTRMEYNLQKKGNKLHATNNKRESLATAYNFVLTIKKTNSRD